MKSLTKISTYFIDECPEPIDHLDEDSYQLAHEYYNIFYARTFDEVMEILKSVKNKMLKDTWSNDLDTCRGAYNELVTLINTMQDGGTYFDEDFEFVLEKVINFERANYNAMNDTRSSTLKELENNWAFEDKF